MYLIFLWCQKNFLSPLCRAEAWILVEKAGSRVKLADLSPGSFTYWAFLVAQLVNNLPAMQETWVQSLGWEDPLEKGKATPLFWPGEFQALYSPWGHKKSDMTEGLSFFLSLTNVDLKQVLNPSETQLFHL